jgi:hypothetical protein
MFDYINNIFRKMRESLGNLPFLKTKNTGVYTMTEEVLSPKEEQEQKNRRARIRKRTHRFVLNRSDRRFLEKVIGEVYVAGSKTTKVLWERVQTLKKAKLSIETKRRVASQFILTGNLYK